jgi:hypothetical protein
MSDPTLRVWGDEDGETYWGEGHIPPAEFFRLCQEYDVFCGADPTEGSGDMKLDEVGHGWWRCEEGMEDDEEANLFRCREHDERAKPFTLWRR